MRTVRLLLTENIDNLGIVGDVVNVRPGYARNFLRPRGLAMDPTPGAIKRLATRRAEVEKDLAVRRAALEGIHEKLNNHEVTLQRAANEQGVLFGGVSQHDIAEALRAEGFAVEDRMVRIGQQIKRLDSYHIPVVLANDLKTEIKLWVVSDKPAEELEAGGGEGGQAASSPEAADTGESARPPTAEAAATAKPRRGRQAEAEPA